MGQVDFDALVSDLTRDLQDLLDSESQGKVDETTYVYRYMPSDRFIDMLENRINTFAHISKWDDPFEGFIFKSAIPYYSEQPEVATNLSSLYASCYGQCWTLEEKESDLRWRAYCPNGNGVRIRTTVGTLKQLMPNYALDSRLLSGMVSYSGVPSVIHGNTMLNVARLLFVKHRHFDIEKEYRLIGFVGKADRDLIRKHQSKFCCRSGFLQGPLDNKLFEGIDSEILADPRMSERELDQLRCRLIQADFTTEIKQSDVYRWHFQGYPV